jgi:putative flavoprotein involved in K+ transport
MKRVDTVIVGGGQAGLAVSRCLTDRGIENVVLERGRVAERWRSERWDSLRLLSPRWQSRLPGFAYDGPDPDGYMSRLEVISYLERYARSFDAPVESGVTVTSVRSWRDGYMVDTDAGSWSADHVVIATGHADKAHVPALAEGLSEGVHQVVPTDYKRPAQLPDGGVLVVGASATGIQLAEEIHASGRPVTLAVGRHTRLPRTYRGQDVLWWLEAMGVLDERAEHVRDLEAALQQPAFQLIGSPERRTLDLTTLQAAGVRLVGHAIGAEGWRVTFGDDLVETVVGADAKLAKLRARMDAFAARLGGDVDLPPPEPFELTPVPDAPTHLDLVSEGIRSVLWATGFRRSYPWLHVPVLDARGEIRHRGGVTDAPGLYVVGLRFLRRRKSNFIDGQADDAPELAEHLAGQRRGHHRHSGPGCPRTPRSLPTPHAA